MPFSQNSTESQPSFSGIHQSFMQHDGLVFSDLLPEEEIVQVFDEHNIPFGQDHKSVYTPVITLWAFLSQMLFTGANRSCLAATARVGVLMAALGRDVSDDSGMFCRARAKLSLTVIKALTLRTAHQCERVLEDNFWLWCMRHVFLVDGTTASMPDTDENQAEWPQPPGQEEGLGFPIIRIVVMISLATGMVAGMNFGPYQGKQTGEMALFRDLLDNLQAGDVFVADRYFCSYFMLAQAQARGIDAVVRLHQRRSADFRRGKRLSKGDRLNTWQRPTRPSWMSEQEYEQMPESLSVRQVRVFVDESGSRAENFVVVTRLLDDHQYPKAEIAALYHKRWLVEVDIRTIKSTMGLDILRCKTPKMVSKELWTGILAYNLIRKTIMEAAAKRGCTPRDISFTAALQKIAVLWTEAFGKSEIAFRRLVSHQLAQLAKHLIGKRPGRNEPRAVKRRPKPQKLMTLPREEARRDPSHIAGRKKEG